LLAYSLKDTLKEKNYRDVGAIAAGNNAAAANGQTRLFVAKGHMDRMNAENVAQYLADECGIDANVVHDIRVFDKFSFVTVPNNEGEMVLGVLGKSRNGRKPLVTRAKEKDGGGGNGGGGSRNGGGGNWGKPKFGGERKSFGGNREGGERSNREGGERTERSNREGGERKSFGERKSGFGDKRKEGGEKKFDKKPFEKREKITADAGERPVRKRENKMTDYLETGSKPASEKPSKKKEGNSDLNDFMKKFDDDLSW